MRQTRLPRQHGGSRRCLPNRGSCFWARTGSLADYSISKSELSHSFFRAHFSNPTPRMLQDVWHCRRCWRRRVYAPCVAEERCSECCVSREMEENAAWSALFADMSGSFGAFFVRLAEKKTKRNCLSTLPNSFRIFGWRPAKRASFLCERST